MYGTSLGINGATMAAHTVLKHFVTTKTTTGWRLL